MKKLYLILLLAQSFVYADFSQHGSGQINGCSTTIKLPQKYQSPYSFSISVTSEVDNGNPIYAYSAYGTNDGGSIVISRDKNNCQYTGYFTWSTIGD